MLKCTVDFSIVFSVVQVGWTAGWFDNHLYHIRNLDCRRTSWVQMEEESSSRQSRHFHHPEAKFEVDIFGICIGSKTVLRYDCSENVCLQCGISCALSDRAVPDHILFGSVDFPHPAPVVTSAMVDHQSSSSNAGATSGFLRCIDDPEGHLKDLSSLRRFIGIPGKSPIFLVPAPLSIESREKLLNVVMGEEEVVHLPPSPRKLFK